jgi:hypothetical protein
MSGTTGDDIWNVVWKLKINTLISSYNMGVMYLGS